MSDHGDRRLTAGTAAFGPLSGYIQTMRRLAVTLGCLLVTLTGLGAGAGAASAHAARIAARRSAHVAAGQALTGALRGGMRLVGPYSGAYVQDLTTGQVLFSDNAQVPRLPASVQKLYTTSTALARFGPNGTLQTTVSGLGQMLDGTFSGTLYLRGGGDPTFGSTAFDKAEYGGTGATIQQLVANLVAQTGLRDFNGNVVADASMFDSLRGTPATGFRPALELEGELSALSFDRGYTSIYGTALFPHPVITAAQQFIAALRAAGVKVQGHPQITTGVTPSTAQPMGVVQSPPMATLLALTNAPSDNYFAETLLKDIGAQFGIGGTTASGAAVVRTTIASLFGLYPRLNDGSGLSRFDRTTPHDVVTLLAHQMGNQPFVHSLAVAGRTGTLQDEMRHTYAQGRCRGKTGTLHDVSNLVGYCTARDGHTLAFALMMNGIDPLYAHPIQDQMVVAIAKYAG